MKNQKLLVIATLAAFLTFGLLSLSSCRAIANCEGQGRFIGYGADTKSVLRHPLSKQYE